MNEADEKANLIVGQNFETLILDNFTQLLDSMPCIYYIIHFKKNPVKIKIFMNFANDSNGMTPAHVRKLGF